MFSDGRVVVTGASGWLAQELISALLEKGKRKVIGVSRRPFPLAGELERLDNQAFLNTFSFDEGDCLIHCAFERGSNGTELVESLVYSGKCFSKAIKEHAAIVNISSQAVYGSNNGPLVSEAAPFAPDYPYALAKASSEVMLESMWEVGRGVNGQRTSLRLASLMGVSKGRTPNNVLGKFVDAAIDGNPIRVVGGSQKFSFLDIHDAVEAIISILDSERSMWKTAYNITPNRQIGIVELAELVVSAVSRKLEVPAAQVILEISDASLDPGGDNSLIRSETGWRQKRPMERIVEDVIEFKLAERIKGDG